MSITKTSSGVTFSVYFTQAHPMRFSHKGKGWPKTTQCVIKKDGLVIGVGEVVKHERDADNYFFAKTQSAKKAFKNAGRKIWKEVRIDLWKEIINTTEK